ncbi:MAG: DNA helicase RecQ [Chloroflexi bacterium]|nr:DNA helicase RecQ [Chloroflexota bacterium]
MAYNWGVLDLLKKHFGFDSFRPLQEEIIGSVLAAEDTLVLMPTGGGKSLCYQLPALRLDGLTLVVSPLIALMKDQVDSLKANGIPADFVNSTLSASQNYEVQREAHEGRLKILYAAPERLATGAFRQFLRTVNLSLLAVDEAHCISQWGHEFRTDYRNLNAIRDEFPSVPIIALTATATEVVRKDIVTQLALRSPEVYLASFNRPNLTYTVQPKTDQYERLIDYLTKHRDRSAIIYRISRQGTEDLAHSLNQDGFSAVAYHAGLYDRGAIQERFIKDDVQIIVATVAFGMGIDKPDIRLVVHYDLPGSVEQYYQETGRAGRDGLPSDCVLFYSFADKIRQDYFIERMESESERDGARRRLKAMIDYGDLTRCRRKYLLEYFDETSSEGDCGGCDICLSGNEERSDATVISQKILSAVVRTGEHFGAAHVAKVLRGAKTKQIRQHNHDKLSVYGIVDDLSDSQIRETINLLLRDQLLEQVGEYRSLAVTTRGRDILKRRENVFLPQLTTKSTPKLPSNRQSEIDYDPELFEKLRALRRNLASERGVPPYVIFGDTAIQQMAHYFPQSDETLIQISGVGDTKLKEFGGSFLTTIRDYCRLHDLEDKLAQNPMPRTIRRRSERTERKSTPNSNGGPNTLEETRKLARQGMSLSEIAEHRQLSKNTVIGHVERLIRTGERKWIANLLPPQPRIDAIKSAFDLHGYNLLSPVREFLGEEYTYDELRLVRAYLNSDAE